MVLIALIIIISITRGGKKSKPLSEEEKAKLAQLQAARREKQDS